jgi:hypothetical protein
MCCVVMCVRYEEAVESLSRDHSEQVLIRDQSLQSLQQQQDAARSDTHHPFAFSHSETPRYMCSTAPLSIQLSVAIEEGTIE